MTPCSSRVPQPVRCVSPEPAEGAECIFCVSPGPLRHPPAPASRPPEPASHPPAPASYPPAPASYPPAPASHPPGLLRGEKRIPHFSPGTPRGCRRPARDPPPSRDDTGPDSCNGGRNARSSPRRGEARPGAILNGWRFSARPAQRVGRMEPRAEAEGRCPGWRDDNGLRPESTGRGVAVLASSNKSLVGVRMSRRPGRDRVTSGA